MSIVQITDLIIGCLFILSVLVGYHRGLVVTIARVVAMVTSYVGAMGIASGMGNSLSYPLVFFVSFGVIQFLLARVVNALKLVDKIPVIGKLDKLGGALFGFFWFFLFCTLLGHVFFQYVPSQLLHQWGFTQQAVGRTVLLSAFAE